MKKTDITQFQSFLNSHLKIMGAEIESMWEKELHSFYLTPEEKQGQILTHKAIFSGMGFNANSNLESYFLYEDSPALAFFKQNHGEENATYLLTLHHKLRPSTLFSFTKGVLMLAYLCDEKQEEVIRFSISEKRTDMPRLYSLLKEVIFNVFPQTSSVSLLKLQLQAFILEFLCPGVKIDSTLAEKTPAKTLKLTNICHLLEQSLEECSGWLNSAVDEVSKHHKKIINHKRGEALKDRSFSFNRIPSDSSGECTLPSFKEVTYPGYNDDEGKRQSEKDRLNAHSVQIRSWCQEKREIIQSKVLLEELSPGGMLKQLYCIPFHAVSAVNVAQQFGV
jgi:hypothetical protein